MNCISCNYEHDEKFCPNCGEKNGIKKITLPSIMEDTFVSVTDMDKGFLFNLKALILNPKKITTDYINGKRKGILNPVSFLILSVTCYIIIMALFKMPTSYGDKDVVLSSSYGKFGFVIGKFITTNLKFFWIFSIIPLGLSIHLIFRRYNFIENLAVSSFVMGQAILGIAISYLFFRIPIIFDPVLYLIIFWMIYRIFKEPKNKSEIFILAATSLFLFLLQLFLILMVIGVLRS